ncbi:hypothetical protein DFH09DRAFT_1338948 [Mycena vulgaris]|nr:hypothetical protein DFH09DRAFT_1338948 [Mycena vulgaris]
MRRQLIPLSPLVTPKRKLAPVTRSARNRRRSSSVPRTREEIDSALNSQPLDRGDRTPRPLSPAAPIFTPPAAIARVGLGIHGRAGLLISPPISPRDFYATVLRAHTPATPPSSPLSSVPPTPPTLLPAALIIPPYKKFTPISTIRDMSFTGPSFNGAGGTAAAMDFLKGVRLAQRAAQMTTDGEKLEDVADRFRHGTPPPRRMNRFAGVQTPVKPSAQLLDELGGMRMTMRELAAGDVTIGGEKIAPMAAFRARVREAVMDADAGAKVEGVWSFHSALPTPIRVAVPSVPADWNAMVLALQNIPQSVVDGALDDHRRSAALDLKMAEVSRWMADMRVHATTATSGGSSNPGAPMQPTGVNPPPAGNTGGAGNGGARNGGARGGGRLRPGTEEEKAQLRAVLQESNSRQHPNTAEGMTRYANDVRSWAVKNPNAVAETIAIHTTEYPLTPGTWPPRSGECWTCGMKTTPIHGRNCTAPRVPELERKFRAACGLWLGVDTAAGRNAAAAAPAVNVVEVDEVEGTPWYEEGVEEIQTPGAAGF